MKNKNILFAVMFSFSISSFGMAASVQKAQMLNDYGLKNEAKKELIDVIFSKAKKSDKSLAYYTLGSIAFDENKINVALESWTILVKKYPKSKKSKLVKNKIQELSEIVGESAKESIKNAVALSYLRHADFWSNGKSNRFTIDSSWIPNVETSIKWYDKTIKEFPGTAASRVAYQDKMRSLLGWKESGRYGSSHGLQKSFSEYMPILINTFEAFIKEHPKASAAQAFRYQIAQAYWREKQWDETKKWLNIIIENAGNSESFYKDTAQRRLLKVEH